MPAYDPFDEDLEPSRIWIPEEPGDSVLGIIVSITDQENQFGPYQRFVLTQRDGSETTVNAFGGALKKRIEDANLQHGDMLKIVYNGWSEFNRDGKATKFKAFDIAVRRAADIERRRLAAAGGVPSSSVTTIVKPAVIDDDEIPY